MRSIFSTSPIFILNSVSRHDAMSMSRRSAVAMSRWRANSWLSMLSRLSTSWYSFDCATRLSSCSCSLASRSSFFSWRDTLRSSSISMLRFSRMRRVSTSACDMMASLLSAIAPSPAAAAIFRGSVDGALVLATGADDRSSSSALVRAVISFLWRTVISSCLSASSLDRSTPCFSALISSSTSIEFRESAARLVASRASNSLWNAMFSSRSRLSSVPGSSSLRAARVLSMASRTLDRADLVFSQRCVRRASTSSSSVDASASSLAAFFSAPGLSSTRRCRKGSVRPASALAPSSALLPSSSGTALMLGSMRDASTAMSRLSSVQRRFTQRRLVSYWLCFPWRAWTVSSSSTFSRFWTSTCSRSFWFLNCRSLVLSSMAPRRAHPRRGSLAGSGQAGARLQPHRGWPGNALLAGALQAATRLGQQPLS
mmetsp:Transcript_30041/g.77667  ORF Transcript_30041/g.77667 Transcript_30041/m.77667 type:complete len:427 (+) Transcript_30041:1552-2832(+)